MDDHYGRTDFVDHGIAPECCPKPHGPVGQVRPFVSNAGMFAEHLKNLVQALDKAQRRNGIFCVYPIGNVVDIRSG
jgi:hypothetical protein